MSDNVTAKDASEAVVIFRARDRGGVKTAVQAMGFEGADGGERLVTPEEPLPVVDPAAALALAAILTELGGKLEAADLAGLATGAKQDAATAVLSSILTELGGKLEATDLAGLATGAKQDAATAALSSILTELGGKLEATDLAGVATGAKQDAAIAALSSLDGKLPGKGQQAAVSSMPVALATKDAVGPFTAQATGNNLLTADGSWFDAIGYNSFSIQIIASAGITAGTVILEQTNDPANAPNGVALSADEQGVINANPITAAVTIAANTARMFKGALLGRYVRARIVTAFSGGTVRAAAMFSALPYAGVALNVQQSTASSLQSTVTGTVTGNMGTSGLAAYTDTSTVLAASATYTGTSRDAGSTIGYNLYCAHAFADVAGVLRVEKSTDGTTWRLAKSVPVAAGEGQELVVRVTARYHRSVFINGAAAQAAFSLTSSYQRI